MVNFVLFVAYYHTCWFYNTYADIHVVILSSKIMIVAQPAYSGSEIFPAKLGYYFFNLLSFRIALGILGTGGGVSLKTCTLVGLPLGILDPAEAGVRRGLSMLLKELLRGPLFARSTLSAPVVGVDTAPDND